MRPDEPSRRQLRPYDAAAEDLTDEFWGPDRVRVQPRSAPDRMAPGRRHHAPVTLAVTRSARPQPDPTKVRAGLFVLGMLLMVPVVLAVRPDRSVPFAAGPVVEAAGFVEVVPADTPAATAATTMTTSVSTTIAAVATSTGGTSTSGPSGSAPMVDATLDPDLDPFDDTATPAVTTQPERSADTAAGRQVAANGAALDVGADVDAPARRVVPSCPQTYTAGAGDSWYRIAQEAGISVDDLLDENNATLLAVIHPGDTICLPAGASVPSPPPTTQPPTTQPPPTTVPSTNLSPQQVQDLIRQTWPADQVDTALAIAWRESNYIATADNGWCCVGVFQIYWSVHKGWLGQFGIHQRDDLKDARKNIAAAYHMWQSQGWGPWGG